MLGWTSRKKKSRFVWPMKLVRTCWKEKKSPTQGHSRHCFASGRHKQSASDLRLGRWRVGCGMNFVGSISQCLHRGAACPRGSIRMQTPTRWLFKQILDHIGQLVDLERLAEK